MEVGRVDTIDRHGFFYYGNVISFSRIIHVTEL